MTAKEIGEAVADWQQAEPSEEFDAGNALVDIIGRLVESELEARAAAEAERSRVKLSLVFPNLPTVFPWEEK